MSGTDLTRRPDWRAAHAKRDGAHARLGGTGARISPLAGEIRARDRTRQPGHTPETRPDPPAGTHAPNLGVPKSVRGCSAHGVGFQRLRWLMSLTVRMQAMARASWARRWRVRRSVLRRSCPKFDSQELVRSMLQRGPRGAGRGRDRDAPAVGQKRPLEPELAPVNRAFAGSLASAGSLVDRPVDAGFGQVQPHDAVIGLHGFGFEVLDTPVSIHSSRRHNQPSKIWGEAHRHPTRA